MATKIEISLEGAAEEIFKSFLEGFNNNPQAVFRWMFSLAYRRANDQGCSLWRDSFNDLFGGLKTEQKPPVVA